MSTGHKHTPGPWHLQKYGHKHGVFGTLSDGRVAATPVVAIQERKSGAARGASPIWHGLDPLDAANLRLISTAPELLEALQELLAFNPVFRSKPCGAEGSAVRAMQDAAIAAEDKARAAILKATGAA